MSIVYEPIGILHSPFKRLYDAPRQPRIDVVADTSYVELIAGRNFEQALQDLRGCDRIWLIVHFHNVKSWKPKVLPPRGRTKRGVFATRSPHRPNPIGITCCELIDIVGLRLDVRGTDLIDGTPVLDIKPYVPYADAHPSSKVDWLETLEGTTYTIDDGEATKVPEQIREYVVRVLRSDPLPHPYRRIERMADGSYELAVRNHRVVYTIEDRLISIRQTRVVL